MKIAFDTVLRRLCLLWIFVVTQKESLQPSADCKHITSRSVSGQKISLRLGKAA